MLFFTDVAIICALPLSEISPVNRRFWHDTVEYRFGINAGAGSEASAIASRAAQHAVDRDGQYIGGVLHAVSTTTATTAELDAYADYLLQPISGAGIFYVSGVTYGSIAIEEAKRFKTALSELRESIEQNGLPTPSFKHPKVVDEHEVDACRLVCPKCGRWVEYDQGSFVYAFIDGLHAFPDLVSRVLSSRAVYDSFVARHEVCISGDITKLRSLKSHDENFFTLDSSLCEEVDPGLFS